MSATFKFSHVSPMPQDKHLPLQPGRHGHPHDHAHNHTTSAGTRSTLTSSVLAWSAWVRVAAMLPVVLLLWLAVWWANEGATLW